MVEIIASVLFLGSTAGAVVFIVKKMPAASQLPKFAGEFRLANVFGYTRNWLAAKIKKNPRLKNFSWIDFTQKQLLKTRVVVMKAENKINDYMVKLHKHAEDQKGKEDALLDNYWHDLKTMVKTRRPVVVKGSQPSETENDQMEDGEPVSIKIETGGMVGNKLSEPGIKVVMPEDIEQKPTPRHKKKNLAGSKKKRFRDPFRW